MSKGTIVKLSQKQSIGQFQQKKSKEERKKADPGILELFHDQYGEPYARIRDIDGTIIVVGVRGKEFKNALVRSAIITTGAPPKRSEINDAIMGYVAFAEKGAEVPMHLRIAGQNGQIYYDLADASGSAVVINAAGWRVNNDVPVRFRKYPVTGAQTMPDPSNTVPISTIFKWVNIQDPAERVLFEVYLVSCFFPDIKYPMIALNGHQGSAKTTGARIVQKLLDPSSVDVGPIPKSPAEIAQLLSHHHFICFDNLSNIKTGVSDLLCQAVTGGTFKKRRLYTDEEDVILRMDSCLAVTGINIVAEKTDLLDRTLLFRFERVDEKLRKDETSLWAEFEAAKPGLLTSIFNTLSEALARLPNQLEKSSRMADFYRVGVAVSQALGYKNREFEKAMERNQQLLQYAVIDGDPLMEAIVLFMQHKTKWNGTATELLEELLKQRGSNGLPKAPNQLTRKLHEIEVNLKDSRVSVWWGRNRSTGLTTIEIRKR